VEVWWRERFSWQRNISLRHDGQDRSDRIGSAVDRRDLGRFGWERGVWFVEISEIFFFTFLWRGGYHAGVIKMLSTCGKSGQSPSTSFVACSMFELCYTLMMRRDHGNRMGALVPSCR